MAGATMWVAIMDSADGEPETICVGTSFENVLNYSIKELEELITVSGNDDDHHVVQSLDRDGDTLVGVVHKDDKGEIGGGYNWSELVAFMEVPVV